MDEELSLSQFHGNMKKWCRTSDRDTQATVSATGIGFHNELQIAVRKKRVMKVTGKIVVKKKG